MLFIFVPLSSEALRLEFPELGACHVSGPKHELQVLYLDLLKELKNRNNDRYIESLGFFAKPLQS